ncbi:aldo/keto reductase [Afifella sp. JA880]|uniref:aldo/keto reductase n=1 Tax=Afifella sp. JA880 TaxID=2975280 RepID=UPI0021BA696A|nr:aldo/keto reductase [Afifella sp. JA880]MCT8269045.1 aldo/keto reductase [Afifella sp. JA880]
MDDLRTPSLSRRALLSGGAALALASALPVTPSQAQVAEPVKRKIPSSGEMIPAVGLGTWITFNVGNDPVLLDRSAQVMEAFFDSGGRVIDSSPMYGSSQDTLGYGLSKLGRPEGLLAADKVWTSSAEDGPEQIERSRRKWNVPRFSLMQVHNLRAWEAHLPMLFDKKDRGEIDYVGITTSEGRRHDLFEEVMANQPLDFVQISYNVLDREVEERILPLARERGIAVIVNRPFRQGSLTRRLEGRPLPDFAAEIGASSWAQFILKFILSHPAVTVAIPATTVPEHARENMAAASGPLPEPELRTRMSAHVRDIL